MINENLLITKEVQEKINNIIIKINKILLVSLQEIFLEEITKEREYIVTLLKKWKDEMENKIKNIAEDKIEANSLKEGISFKEANLKGANLKEANLKGANLRKREI